MINNNSYIYKYAKSEVPYWLLKFRKPIKTFIHNVQTTIMLSFYILYSLTQKGAYIWLKHEQTSEQWRLVIEWENNNVSAFPFIGCTGTSHWSSVHGACELNNTCLRTIIARTASLHSIMFFLLFLQVAKLLFALERAGRASSIFTTRVFDDPGS